MADLSYTIIHTLYCSETRPNFSSTPSSSSLHSVDVDTFVSPFSRSVPSPKPNKVQSRRPLMSDRPAISARGARGGHYFGPHLRVFQPRLGPCQRSSTELSSESDTVTGAWRLASASGQSWPIWTGVNEPLGLGFRVIMPGNLILDIGRFGVHRLSVFN